MTIPRYFLFMAVFLFLFSSASAFEDTFQYYPSGDYSDVWYTDEYVTPGHGYDVYHDIITHGGTYSRCLRLEIDNDAYGNTYFVQAWHYTPAPSNYWSVNFRGLHTYSNTGGDKEQMKLNVYFYDEDGYLLMTHDFITSNTTYQYAPNYGSSGWFEYLRDSSSNQVTLRVNGVDKGVVGSASKQMAYISFRIDHGFVATSDSSPGWMYIDDVTSGGNIVGFGSESITHTVTEAFGDDTNISFGLNSFPLSSFTASEYKVDIKRSVGGVYTNVVNEVVKSGGVSTPIKGFSNWNRSVDLTDDDTSYGLYMVYLLGDGVSIDTDYFFFAPPGDVSTISFSNPEIPIGTTESITYSIDGADFGTYNYHVRIYSTTAQIQSTQVSEVSNTVTWDTTDENTGLHYAVLSRTDKTSGAYSEMVYDIATLTEDVIIKGYVYDAQNESTLVNVSINFSQASAWYNTTSNTTGYYELTGLTENVEINVNASLVNYTHENFTFTPLSAEIYTMNLYLINNTPTYSNTTIGGLVYDYPMHQAVTGATVNIYNATWSDTNTSSSITGFYLFEELTNGSYTVNATKTDYQDSDEYPADTNNGSWLTQNILMYGIYDLTIRAQDATTGGYLSTFSVDYGGVISSTTNGSITYSGLTYGLYTFSVSATGYYSDSEDILVDSTKTETIQLTQTDSIYYTPHYVKFTVQSIWGDKYGGVDVSVYDGSATTTTYTGVTGNNDGAVSFRLYETTQYRITFINTSAGISREITIYPVDTHYIIWVTTLDIGIPDVTGDTVQYYWATERINSTYGYINFSWTDTSDSTTAFTYWVNDSDNNPLTGYPITTSSTNYTNSTIVPANGDRYYVHVIGLHPTWGEIDASDTIFFRVGRMVDLGWAEDWMYATVALCAIVFVGLLFGAVEAHYGAVFCVMFAWLFRWIGWLDNSSTSTLLLILATVVAFGFAMRKGEVVRV